MKRNLPSSDGNADIGAKHEFGFTTDGGLRIPARSFLRVPLSTHRGEIAGMMKMNVMRALVYGKLELLFKHLGIACEKIVDQAFQTSGWGTWRPNAPFTVLMKGSDKPLIDTAQLRRSVASKVQKL
jgi:phage gpG-like protein